MFSRNGPKWWQLEVERCKAQGNLACHQRIISVSYTPNAAEVRFLQLRRVPFVQRNAGRRRTVTTRNVLLGAMIAGVLLATVLNLSKLSASTDDVKTVASLDTEYQEAVKKNDAVTMNRLLAGDFILVVGSGKIFSKADLLDEARGGKYVYEHQEDTSQTVRVWGDTAIVTAKLWAKGMKDGKPFDYTLWFSDTYVRSSSGWRYVFGQASLPLPMNP